MADLRVLSVSERERLLGFDVNITHGQRYAVLSRTLKCSRAWTENLEFTKGEGDTQKSRALVTEYLRLAEKNGPDVRLDVGLPFKPRAWPQAVTSTPSRTWHWKFIHGYPLTLYLCERHINYLEMRAVFNEIRWRCRGGKQDSSRFLQPVCSSSILTKGRTSSRVLQCLLKRLTALVLAHEPSPTYGYISTAENPADIPSRCSLLRTSLVKRGGSTDL
eukprot:6489141-Amphidinium_carterae.2